MRQRWAKNGLERSSNSWESDSDWNWRGLDPIDRRQILNFWAGGEREGGWFSSLLLWFFTSTARCNNVVTLEFSSWNSWEWDCSVCKMGCGTKKVCRHSFFTLFCTFTFTFFFIFPFFWKSHLNFAFCLGWGAVALRLYWETLTEGGAGCGESSELKRRRQVENTELMHVSIVCKLDIACAAQMLNASELKKQSSVYQPTNWKWCNLCKFQCFPRFCGVARIFPNSLLRASGVGMTKLYKLQTPRMRLVCDSSKEDMVGWQSFTLETPRKRQCAQPWLFPGAHL